MITIQRFSFIIIFTIFGAITSPAASLASDFQEASRATANSYKVFQKSVEETQHTLDKVADTLAEVERRLRLSPDDPKLKKVIQKLEETREALVKEAETFGTFSKYSKKTASGFEVILKADSIINDANARRGGPLARNLHILAKTMEEFGEKLPVPLVRDIIKAYGQVTGGLLNATDALGDQLRKKNAQGALGVYGSQDDERWLAFVKQFPEKTKGVNLMPQEAPFIYQDEFNTSAPERYIWDGDKWYKADNKKLSIRQSLIDSIQAGKRPDAQRIIHMQENADFYAKRSQVAKDLHLYLLSLKKGIRFDRNYINIFEANFKGSDKLEEAMSDPEIFRSYLTCDEHFSRDLSQRILKTHKALSALDKDALKDLQPRIKALEKLAKKINLNLGTDKQNVAATREDIGQAELPVYVQNTADRSSVSGAEIVALKRGTEKRFRSRSGPDGKAILKGLSPGSYRIAGRAENFQPFVTQAWKVFETNNGVVTLYLDPAVPIVPVTVKVIDKETRKPIAGALVSVSGSKRYWQNTRGNGKTTFDLSLGSWTVVGDAYGYNGMVTTTWVDPESQNAGSVSISLPRKPEELSKKKEETEHNIDVFEPKIFFAKGDANKSVSSKVDTAELNDGSKLPQDLTTRDEINTWCNQAIARLKREGNARLDTIRAELKKMEGKNIHHSCGKCGNPGPHYWDGYGWSCACGYTVLSVGEYPTSAGAYTAVKNHYLKLIGQVNSQANKRLSK